MYKQFCKNLNNYMNIISDTDGNNARKQIAEAILPLADISLYSEHKLKGNSYAKTTANLIYRLSQYSKAYPSLDRFIWELWAYGFDIEPCDGLDSEADNMEEADVQPSIQMDVNSSKCSSSKHLKT